MSDWMDAAIHATPGTPIRLNDYQPLAMMQLQQAYNNMRLAAQIEPYIPTRMEDWDKEFWLATGIVVPGTTCRDLV